jgi:hypothetical protein
MSPTASAPPRSAADGTALPPETVTNPESDQKLIDPTDRA